MKTIFTAIASTIIIGSLFTVACADSALISAATASYLLPTQSDEELLRIISP
ncbi:hypothetical protein ACSDBR_09590 [Acidithiobacillus ferriphilus]|uniref:hypothetical protein n=1 Tax=Acidithiobacillus ferriphilus TaxID=1689834 RepID=UPI003F51439C